MNVFRGVQHLSALTACTHRRGPTTARRRRHRVDYAPLSLLTATQLLCRQCGFLMLKIWHGLRVIVSATDGHWHMTCCGTVSESVTVFLDCCNSAPSVELMSSSS